jgi:hypothetical protein
MADGDLIIGLAEAAKHDSPDYEKKLSDSIAADSFDNEDDSIHEGLEFPTEEELLTLRRVSDAIPWNAYRESSCWNVALLFNSTFSSDCSRGTGGTFLGEFIFISFCQTMSA